jgi:hypothetical protein
VLLGVPNRHHLDLHVAAGASAIPSLNTLAIGGEFAVSIATHYA